MGILKVGLAAALVVPLSMAAAWAQDAPPARNGNIYDFTSHEPNPATTKSEEQSAGVGLSQQQQQQQTNMVEQLNKQLQQRANQDTGVPVDCSATGTCKR